MVKQIEVTKVMKEPEYIECDRCHKRIQAKDCAECIYNAMSHFQCEMENKMIEFDLCHDCFKEIVERDKIDAAITDFSKPADA